MPWAKSFWAFSPYLNHMRNFSYFITLFLVAISEMSAQRYYFFCIYTNRSLKESFLKKNTKVHPKWLLIKKTRFLREKAYKTHL